MGGITCKHVRSDPRSHSHIVCAFRPRSHQMLTLYSHYMWSKRKTPHWNSKCQGMAFMKYPWSTTVQTNITVSHPPSSVQSSVVVLSCLCSAQHEGGLVAEIKQDHQLSASCFPRTWRWQLEQENMMCCPLPSGEGPAHYTPSLHPFIGWWFISLVFVLLCGLLHTH